jgi:hypothetical protein
MHAGEELSLDQIQGGVAGQRRDPVRGQEAERDLRMGAKGSGASRAPAARPASEGDIAAVRGEMTGLSRAQVTRLIGRYRKRGKVEETADQRRRFALRCTAGYVELLAQVDQAHQTLSGPATRRILEREYQEYGKKEYERLAGISVAQLNNLRQIPKFQATA